MASSTENAIRIGLAIILHPDRREVLIARRKKGTHLAQYWEFPGGKIEAEETASVCAVRESLEETGLAVIPISEWEPVYFAYPERTVLLHPVLCQAATSGARPLESEEIAWVGPGNLDSYDFPAANDTIVAKLRGYLRDLPASAAGEP